jgi:hypothetical protein
MEKLKRDNDKLQVEYSTLVLKIRLLIISEN